jgi:hypothetical protein
MEARNSVPAERKSTPAVKRISATNDDLKQVATRFKQERYSRPKASTSRASQVKEKRSQGRSSETRAMQAKGIGADRRAVRNSSALRERGSTQKGTDESTRATRSDRFSNRGFQRGSSSPGPQNSQRSARNSKYSSFGKQAAKPQFQNSRMRSYGEAARSRGFDKPGRMRNAQPQMSRPAGPMTGMSQPQVHSPQPSRGGDQAISGRSGGGSSAGNRSMRANIRSRMHRR